MDNSKNLGTNLKYLRELKGLQQAEMLAGTGITRGTWSNYELSKTNPSISDLLKICDFFGVTVDDILRRNLELEKYIVDVKGNTAAGQNKKIVDANVERSVDVNTLNDRENTPFLINVVGDTGGDYGKKNSIIPITDISVAAGSGAFNSEYIEKVESIRLPQALIRSGNTYLCVKIKGASMSPTLQDGGYVVIRLLDRTEWAKMPDERIYVVCDKEGKSYLKRVKNRFKQDLIILKSDNPDQATFTNFNLTSDEIASIWYVEWYFSAKMPNINDLYYSRLQKLEDKFDLLLSGQLKINH